MDENLSSFTAHVDQPTVIEIRKDVARVRARSGDVEWSTTLSVRDLAVSADRAQRALQRHAAGEENIVVDD